MLKHVASELCFFSSVNFKKEKKNFPIDIKRESLNVWPSDVFVCSKKCACFFHWIFPSAQWKYLINQFSYFNVDFIKMFMGFSVTAKCFPFRSNFFAPKNWEWFPYSQDNGSNETIFLFRTIHFRLKWLA